MTELFRHRDLLFAWTSRIIRARYQQSILGGLWAILQPVATVAILTMVFSFFLRVSTPEAPYLVFAYAALVPWMWFSTSVTDMVESVVSNMNLVGKIHFPREILVLAAMLARLLDFAIAYSLLLIMMMYYGLPVLTLNWLYLPLILVVQAALALGLGLGGAALNVFYRDIKHVLTLLLQLWFYATPIIYPITLVPETLRPWYFLNPLAGVIESYRTVLINNQAPGPHFYLAVIVAVCVLGLGYWLFKSVEHRFADVI